MTYEEILDMFGEDTANIVSSVTKISNLRQTFKINNPEKYRRIIVGLCDNPATLFIKFADRLHNLRTLGALSHERQIALSQETLDVFVPIAHRLGLDLIRSEMADICLSYLHPEEFQLITKLLKK